MRLLKKIVVLLNFPPFTYFFKSIYGAGLRYLLYTLKRLPAIHSIYGSGSYFSDNCLYGHSDIDLMLVIDDGYTATDAASYQVCEYYNRVRKFFPFLASWSEMADSLVYLSDIGMGFPSPDLFKLRLKQDRLVKLWGKELPHGLVAGPATADEIIIEINAVLRMVLTKNEIHKRHLLFWKRIFDKIFSLSENFDVDLKPKRPDDPELAFLAIPERRLFFKRSNPDVLFPLLIEFVRLIFIRAMENSRKTRIDYATVGDIEKPPDYQRFAAAANMEEILSKMIASGDVNMRMLSPSLIGITPKNHYFGIGECIPLIEISKNHYRNLNAIIGSMMNRATLSTSLLVKIEDLLFVLHKLKTYVDVVPADPVIFPNLHAALSNSRSGFEIIETVYKSLADMTEKMFAAQARMYRKSEGWVEKLPFPCLYIEDDLTVIKDAFHRLRVFYFHKNRVDIQSLDGLESFLRCNFPECESFVTDLFDYYRYLRGHRKKKINAGNIYRCLHQFMAQVLTNASPISVGDHRKRLGITVGIITRNRATELKEVLESLTRQERSADEVLVVDNNSTDQTRQIVSYYSDILPIAYYFLGAISIPLARNMVIEKAKHEIVSFTDDDCIVEPGWLAAVERGFLRADNVGIVGGWVRHEPSFKPSLIDTYYSLFHHNTT